MDPIASIIQFPPDPAGRDRVPRCLACGYRLIRLQQAVCPECGRPFNPADEGSFSRRAPFIWYLYWWPGALLAVGAGLFWCVAFYTNQTLGWGLFIAVPFMVGALVGYRPSPKRRMGWAIAKAVGFLCALMLVVLLMVGEFAGMFCGLILIVIFLVPTLGGFYFGVLGARALAVVLKNTRFSQREHLPLVWGLLLMPGAAHLAEHALAPPIGIETVQTARVLEMDRMRAWDAWLFYEEVEHARPLLLRLGLPTPSHVEGRIQAVGDQEVCVYTGSARLVKMATDVRPGERLAFDVVGQENFENNSIRLIDGAFDFAPAGHNATRVTLTTRYEPLLRPRVLWRPIENAFASELHGHVLHGMGQRDAQNRYAQQNGGRP